MLNFKKFLENASDFPIFVSHTAFNLLFLHFSSHASQKVWNHSPYEWSAQFLTLGTRKGPKVYT